tara:strand:+ start:271 stop:1050 length:780 start_codon:yes stop_codon:yes gene_type:complete
MPEGPEAKYLELLIRKFALNKKLKNIVSNTKTTKQIPSSSKVVDTGSRGKIFWLKTKSYWVHLHMGLTGWLVFDEPKIYKYVLEFENGNIWLKDQRRFSRVDIFETEEDHNKALEKIGKCIFCKDFTLENFKEVIKSSKRNISSFLLDQSKFAGIGNYIRNDALYLAKVSPKRKTNTLTDKEIKDLYDAIMHIIYSSLETWMDTLDIKMPARLEKLAPKKLADPYEFYVYDRDIDPDGNKVKREKVAGRNTFWVPSVQK